MPRCGADVPGVRTTSLLPANVLPHVELLPVELLPIELLPVDLPLDEDVQKVVASE